MAEITDTVQYDGRVHEVLDVKFQNAPHVLKSSPHSLDEGAILMYLVKDIQSDDSPNKIPLQFWVNADAVDPYPEDLPEDMDIENDFFEQDIDSPHLLELGGKMLNWLDGLEARPDNDKLPEIVTYLLSIQYDKEGGYGSSWKGRGEYRGIMSNIDRKFDRLDKIVNDEIAGTRPKLPDSPVLTTEEQEQVGESKIDAVADLAVYCLLYLTWLREHKPGAFKLWVDKNVPKYLHDKIPFITNYYR